MTGLRSFTLPKQKEDKGEEISLEEWETTHSLWEISMTMYHRKRAKDWKELLLPNTEGIAVTP